MLDQLYTYMGTCDIPGELEELERLATRVEELAAINGRSWVRANRQILLMQWTLALKNNPAGGAGASKDEGEDG